jgi:hypothetical protein
MDFLIRVKRLANGRVEAMVVPAGPRCEADSRSIAVEHVKKAHQACIEKKRGVLPLFLSETLPHYLELEERG